MRVVFTARAARHVERLHRWIAANSYPDRADEYASRLVAFCRGLAASPHRGTRRDDLFPGLRTVGFERRVAVAFTVEGDVVLIRAVAYAGRDLARDLG